MKMKNMYCPYCGAKIEIDNKGHNVIFCPYCGNQIILDSGDTTYTYNYNKTYTNAAAVEKEKRKDKEDERKMKVLFVWFGLMAFMLILNVLIAGIAYLAESHQEKKMQNSGMVKIGQSSKEIEGRNYTIVVEELEAVGFENIKTIDLNDSGWFTNKEDTVESIAISGKTTFYESDYFDLDSKIVISYH